MKRGELRDRQYEQSRSGSWQAERDAAARDWSRKLAEERLARLGPHTCPDCGGFFSHPRVTMQDQGHGDTVVYCPLCGWELKRIEHKGRIAKLLDRIRSRSGGSSDRE